METRRAFLSRLGAAVVVFGIAVTGTPSAARADGDCIISFGLARGANGVITERHVLETRVPTQEEIAAVPDLFVLGG